MAAGTRRVAIACQGGGPHTAFTAGVLKSWSKLDRRRESIDDLMARGAGSGGGVSERVAANAVTTTGKGSRRT